MNEFKDDLEVKKKLNENLFKQNELERLEREKEETKELVVKLLQDLNNQSEILEKHKESQSQNLTLAKIQIDADQALALQKFKLDLQGKLK